MTKLYPHDWDEPVENIARCKRCKQLTYVFGDYLSSDTHNCPAPTSERPLGELFPLKGMIRQLHIHDPNTGRRLLSLRLSPEQSEALDRVIPPGRGEQQVPAITVGDWPE